MTDTPTPSAALIAEARKLRDHLRGVDSDSGEAHLLDRLADGVAFAVDALAAAEARAARLEAATAGLVNDAARWHRAVCRRRRTTTFTCRICALLKKRTLPPEPHWKEARSDPANPPRPRRARG